jgi:VanZ family protein
LRQLAHLRTWTVASAALIGAVLYLSLAPIESQAQMPANFDKLEHALAYMLLAVWFAGLYARKDYWRIGLALAALGLVVEILQHVMALGRSGDPRDMVANITGICLGLALAVWRVGGWAVKLEAWLSRN